jgi:hypothetical protein
MAPISITFVVSNGGSSSMLSLCCRLFFAGFLCLSINSIAATQGELELVEKLHDVEALKESGINFQDYSKIMQEVVILYSRYTRNGGDNDHLRATVEWNQKAKTEWAQGISEGNSYYKEIIQKCWNYSSRRLAKYDEETRQSRSVTSKKGKR